MHNFSISEFRNRQQTRKDLAVRMSSISVPDLRLVIYRQKKLTDQNNDRPCVVIKVQCKWIVEYSSETFRTFEYTSTAFYSFV